MTIYKLVQLLIQDFFMILIIQQLIIYKEMIFMKIGLVYLARATKIEHQRTSYNIMNVLG